MYLDEIAELIRSEIPTEAVPEGDSVTLFRMYAVLLRAKGAEVSECDVHDAWSAWTAAFDSDHPALLRYEDLDRPTRKLDEVYCEAIRRIAFQLGEESQPAPAFSKILFPSGPPKTEQDKTDVLELYKIMVSSSESLVGRRQGVNTFFLTINGALLTAAGLLVQNAGADNLIAAGIAILFLTGAILCLAWRSLIKSFGQLNRGKFKVINTIESHLKTAIYAAEWEALGRGEHPSIYRSFTSREIWVPNSLFFLHVIALILSVLFVFDCLPV
ncbi:MAG: hypothetical protein RIE53_10290 [Rhodothermales bacterium]